MSGPKQVDEASTSPGLTIGELARRTGVTTATLRIWEERHGFPEAERLPSGHRRYPESVVSQVQQVRRRRDEGLRLDIAISEVRSAHQVTAVDSVFATLATGPRQSAANPLRKASLIAFSQAIEDECCARAERPWLFGAFQEARFFRHAEPRWRELARTARDTWVFADFEEPREAGRLHQVALPSDSILLREWSVVCLADDLPVALAAWEVPGQEHLPDSERVFEALWTLDPSAVRAAARTFSHILDDLGQPSPALEEALQQQPRTEVDVEHAARLFSRVVQYVDERAARARR